MSIKMSSPEMSKILSERSKKQWKDEEYKERINKENLILLSN
jgi:hypothetical protein